MVQKNKFDLDGWSHCTATAHEVRQDRKLAVNPNLEKGSEAAVTCEEQHTVSSNKLVPNRMPPQTAESSRIHSTLRPLSEIPVAETEYPNETQEALEFVTFFQRSLWNSDAHGTIARDIVFFEKTSLAERGCPERIRSRKCPAAEATPIYMQAVLR